ncbi:MAG TPA: hypothetical protein VKW76_13160 [Candidatus Binatia bacterium]|nr:hypothetical protein [Candidatus Binatia bacterium]
MRRVGLLAVGGLLCLAAAGWAQTTTTTSSTTTTTVACTAGPTLDSITCRLAEIQQLVSTAPDVGKLQTRLLSMISRAQKDANDAASAPNTKKEKTFLKRLATVLNSFNFTARSLRGRKTIGSQTRGMLKTLGPALLTDVKTLLKSL